VTEPTPARSPASVGAGIVESWNSRAEEWDAWTPITDVWFADVTQWLIERLELRPGDTVLELGAGTGGLTKRILGSTGGGVRVVVTDSGARMIERAARNLAAEGLENFTIRVMDGGEPNLPAASVDAIACRQGFMFFEHPDAALKRLLVCLRPGGRIALSVFSTPDRNPFLSVPIGILSRWADLDGKKAPPPTGAPGPFSLGKPGRLEGLLTETGFDHARVESIPSPLSMPSLDDLLRFYQETLGELVEDLSVELRTKAWAEVAAATEPYVAPGSRGAPCEILVASGRRPGSPAR
jgi:SAM-dependent methyltransferase